MSPDILLAILVASAAQAQGADTSAQRLVASWLDDDPGMKMVAEVFASAFASGFSWGGEVAGKQSHCAPPDLKGLSEVAPDFGTSGLVGRSLLRMGQDGAADDEDETED